MALLVAAACLWLGLAASAYAYLPGDSPLAPPHATFTWSPAQPLSGQPVTFTSTAWSEGSFFCDFDPWIVDWKWDLDGDLVFESSGPTVTHTYFLPGPVLVSHRVTDNCNRTGSSTSLLVVRPAATIGGGNAGGNVHFASPGVPPAGSPCAPATFTLSGSSDAFLLNTALTGYAGPVTLTGTGSSSCEVATSGGGALTLDAHGTGFTGGTIDCTGLTGSYTRVATEVGATLAGTCTVNNFPVRVSFVFDGEFVPTGAGAGVTAPVSDASFQGAFAVAPA